MDNSKTIHKLEKLKNQSQNENAKKDIQNKIDILKGNKTVEK